MKATVTVELKNDILDPQGKTVQGVLNEMGYPVSNVRVGKQITLELPDQDEVAARKALEEMSTKLLSNPVIENFTVHLPGNE